MSLFFWESVFERYRTIKLTPKTLGTRIKMKTTKKFNGHQNPRRGKIFFET